jgi:hypothetical protein
MCRVVIYLTCEAVPSSWFPIPARLDSVGDSVPTKSELPSKGNIKIVGAMYDLPIG